MNSEDEKNADLLAAPPFGLFRRTRALARHLPGFALAERGFLAGERLFLRELNARLEAVGSGNRTGVRASPGRRGGEQGVRKLLENLMEQAMEQSPEDGRRMLYISLLKQLLPDEARMLSALSDGSAYVLIHVGMGMPLSPVSQKLAENLSDVGNAAGVSVRDAAPAYITHLRHLGLVRIGPEDKLRQSEYELLETHARVLDVARTLEKTRYSMRILRRTLSISNLGRALWEAASPDQGEAH